MRRTFGVAVASVLGAFVALTTPVAVSAALLWTLTASPLTVSTGTATTFTLTASNMLLGRIECVVVDVPANFNIVTVGVVGSTTGDTWLARRANNRVTAWTTTVGGAMGLLDSVTFTVSATALSAGSLAWHANAYDRADCTGTASLLGVPPIVVVTGPAVTPSPVPTLPPLPTPTLPPLPTPTLPPLPTLTPSPAPTRTPTPTPTATPLVPLPSIPIPLPTVGLPGIPGLTPRPDASPSPAPTGSSASTAPPRPTSVPDASTGAIGQPGDGSSGPPPPSGGPGAPVAGVFDSPALNAPRVAFDEPELELGVGSLGLLAGAPTWVVPVATIGGPGLIVLLWVAAQAGGASIWIPAARRLRGEERRATG